MQTTDEITEPPATPVRREWTRFRSPGRLIAMTAAALAVILIGLLLAAGRSAGICSDGEVEVVCPTGPTSPDGQPVSDTFAFVHQPLGENGAITARLTSMTGIITYPPPGHDELVPGVVPWAKAGLIIKDGLAQGSSYAALMVTGGNGVRMQYDYTHDVAGGPGGVSEGRPRWLRLTRSGDTITGEESADGARWTKVGTAHLPGLPATVRIGLFATSPGDLTLRRTALGASLPESRFTQATAVFDDVVLDGAPAGDWSTDLVGGMGHTDWERYHRAPGLVESNGTLTVTGSGDIGPASEGVTTASSTFAGLVVGLVIVLVVAVRFTAPGHRSGRPGARTLRARAAVLGAAAFLTGLVAAGVVLPAGSALLRSNGIEVPPVSAFTGLRVVIGVAALFAATAVFALALGTLLRRTWTAVSVAVTAVVLPYVLSALPLLPDELSRWLLRLTPAAAFSVQQTLREYPQTIAHYAPSGGYFPLPWWAGLAVLCGYAAIAFGLAASRPARRDRLSPFG